MNEDFFTDAMESNVSKKKVLIILGVLILIGCGIFLYFKFTGLRINSVVTYEVGDTFDTSNNKYVLSKIEDSKKLTIDFKNIVKDDNNILTTVGEYEYTVTYDNKKKVGKIKVVDTIAPKVEVTDLTVGVDEDFDPDEFLTLCDDYSKPCLVQYRNNSDEELVKKEGEYQIDLVVKDKYENATNVTVKLIVKKDYDRNKVKREDLKIDHIDPDYEDWNKSMIISFDKAIEADEIDDSEEYDLLMETSSDDLTQYLPTDYKDYSISETEIVYVYNKYDYIIGFAFRVKLSSGKYVYLTK